MKIATVIDVGVAYGTDELYEHFNSSNILLIEPIAEWENKLIEFKARYKADYVIAAAGSTNSEMIINVHSILSDSSVFHEIDGPLVDGQKRIVPLRRIDDLCKERELPGPFLIKLDVQGAELLVMDGATSILDETEIVIIEVSLFKFRPEAPEFFDVVAYMNKLGFAVYDVFEYIKRPLDGALGQIDIAFVKENGFFRKSHSFAPLEWYENRIRTSRTNPIR